MNHAITRIVSFLVIAMFLALGEFSVIIVCSILTIALYLIDPPEDLSKILFSIYRMKWFFLSIMVVYLLIDSTSISWWSKMAEGIKRIVILVLMMMLVSWLMNKTPRDKILSAIIFLLKPLRYLGISIETVALRIELIFQNIETVRILVSEKKLTMKQGKKNISEIGKVVSGLYLDLIEKVDEKPLQEITIDLKNAVPFDQWILPSVLFIFLSIVHNLL